MHATLVVPTGRPAASCTVARVCKQPPCTNIERFALLSNDSCDSFLDDSLGEGTSQIAAPPPSCSHSFGSPPALTREELVVAAPRRVALVADGDTHGVTSVLARKGVQGQGKGRACIEVGSSSLQASSEILSGEDNFTWRERQNGQGDGAVAYLRRPAAATSARLSEGTKVCMEHASPQTSPSAPTPSAVGTAAGDPAALGISKQSPPDAAVATLRDSRKAMSEAAKSPYAFTSPTSPLGDGKYAARRCPVMSVGGTRNSDFGTMVRSPMSARVDVLQNLLAPAVMAEKDRRQEHSRLLESAEVQGNMENGACVRRTEGGSGVDDENVSEINALERLLVHSATTGDPGRSSICDDDDNRNTNGVGTTVSDIAKRVRSRSSLHVVSRSSDKKIGDGGDRPRTPDTKPDALQDVRVRPLPTCVQADKPVVALKHGSSGGLDYRSADNEGIIVRGIGTGVHNKGGLPHVSLEGTDDFLQLPSFLARSANERCGVQDEASEKVDRSELDDLKVREELGHNRVARLVA